MKAYIVTSDGDTAYQCEVYSSYDKAVERAAKLNMPQAEMLIDDPDYAPDGCYDGEDRLPPGLSLDESAEEIAENMAVRAYCYTTISDDYNEYEEDRYSFFYVTEKRSSLTQLTSSLF